MQKTVAAIASALFLTFFANFAQAKEVYACIDEAGGGLQFKNGIWQATRFNVGRFILTFDGQQYVTRGLAGDVLQMITSCSEIKGPIPHIACRSEVGDTLIFSRETMKGGRSALFGSIFNGDTRDTLVAIAFTCQRF